MVQAREAADGTDTLLLDGMATMTGLTRIQAGKLTTSFVPRAPSAPSLGEARVPAHRSWHGRAVFGQCRSAL